MLAEASAFEMASRHFHPLPGEFLHISIGASSPRRAESANTNGIKSDIAMYGVKHTRSTSVSTANTIA